MLHVVRTLALAIFVVIAGVFPHRMAPSHPVAAVLPTSATEPEQVIDLRVQPEAESFGLLVPERRAASAEHRAAVAAEAAAQALAAQNALALAQAVRPVIVAPAPPAAPAAPPAGRADVQAMINQAFAPLGPAAVAWAQRVAMCESGDNPNSYNASSGASGVFQFLPSTWAHTPEAGRSVFDAQANVQAAAWMYGRGGGGAWSCR